MIRVFVALYLLSVCIYYANEDLHDPKVNKLKLMVRIAKALIIGLFAVALLSIFVILF